MNTTLIIMAAGIGSRYGKGIKQLAKIGPHDEIIMDYSIYDAIEAGFNKVVFIIRKDIEKEFKEVKEVQPSKHPLPIYTTLDTSSIVYKAWQLWNAALYKVVTCPIPVTDVKDVQLLNAHVPNLIKVDGNITVYN